MIQAGGDVIVVGGASLIGQRDFKSSLPVDSWSEIPLLVDQAYAARIRYLVPPSDDARPREIPPRSPTSYTGNGALYAGTDGNRFVCYAVRVGNSASVGRGGTDATTWWIQPVPEKGQASQLSRRHASFELRDGHAWVTDHSGNGTWLNGQRLVQERAEVLSDRDQVNLAKSLTLTARLGSDGDRVTDLVLDRGDELGDRLHLALVSPGEPLRAAVGAESSWVVWSERSSAAATNADNEWIALPSGDEIQLSEGLRLAWHVLDGAIDQAQIL